ncbi:LOW QUALITY PROTEIN: hypothetical protein CVT26_014322 [Gymnopilus dilepis]|uniref:RNase H type-1 domain-containing protein n=1 Tax=Gymnopilus dilepis TaxID=231916 RepID=A0A409WTV0_9AGAR|nr:LOW QUALITY PROTEIN: hypothetical protein CVT26_014322 [Gymnopilus dilepis]
MPSRNKTFECFVRRTLSLILTAQSRASLRRHARRDPQPGAYIIEDIHSTYKKLEQQHPKFRIKFRCVPGHEGIERSERADEEAKISSEGAERNKAAAKEILKKELPQSCDKARIERTKEEEADTTFRKLPRYRKIEKIDPSMPSPRFRMLTKGMARRSASLLVQLRTEHVPLKAYLHKFKLADEPTCEQCDQETPETAIHFLQQCPAYRRPRRQLKHSIGHEKDVDLTLLANKENLRHLFKYVKDTGRFNETHGDVEIPERQDDDDEDNESW